MNRAKPKFLTCMLGAAVLAACGTPGVPMPPALELAKPVTDLRAARKGARVYLAWTVPVKTTDHQTVRHPGPTRICRSLKVGIDDCKKPVAEIPASQFPVPELQKKTAAPPKIQATYTDILPQDLQRQDPTADLVYAVSALNESGRSAGLSNLVQVPSAETLPPPDNLHSEVESDGVLLSWTCPAEVPANPAIAYKLRIYRRERGGQGQKTDTRLAEVNWVSCAENKAPQFLDQTFEWEKYYDYRGAVVTVIAEPGKPEVEVEGDDTPAVEVFAHDIFPPAVPAGLQAVFSGVGQKPFVDLVWSPDTEADLAGYNIFRREEGGQPVKVNSELVKSPAYRDNDVAPGKKYFYSVSAVDERDNESARSPEASEQVP
ncbi:MAG TPA: hypothetical protein VHS34_17865 [Terriglobales bacterium]|nr:hypothetical protein [Terriglobales bacterium]